MCPEKLGWVSSANDDLSFTFDGFLLATSHNSFAHHISNGMIKVGELVEYDRSKVIGKKWEGTANPGCAFGAKCDFSLFRETGSATPSGTFVIEMTSQFVENLPPEKITGTKHTIGLHTTGQGDSEVDCSHSGFTFDVKTKYIGK